ncbi:hypothetical protein ACWYXJ_29375 [Janthinobacterium lividum]
MVLGFVSRVAGAARGRRSGQHQVDGVHQLLAGATLFLQLIITLPLAGAAGALRSSTVVARTTSTARTSCCTAPGRRHPVPAADLRPEPPGRRRRAARGRRSGQHHVDVVRQLLAST